ncbi:MAG: hypothetical protein AMXMBFR48_25440 [Ignavibacteriales bacterium]|jgi:nitrogen-specific signal transduction histidine kinase
MNSSEEKNTNKLATDYLPAEKTPEDLLFQESEAVAANRLLQACVEAMPEFILILNKNREIIGGNERFLRTFGFETLDEALGKRFGDAVECVNSKLGPNGCGTSVNCRTCGATNSIVTCAETNTKSINECYLTLRASDAVEFEVIASPLQLGPYDFLMLSLRDISAEKRKKILERVFFHDVLNTAGGLQGLAGLIAMETDSSREEVGMMMNLTERLIDEIKLHRDLLSAEKGDFLCKPQWFKVTPFMREMKSLYAGHTTATGKELLLDEDENADIYADKVLLSRVIGNLIKNALEASQPGERVTLSYTVLQETVAFSVNNPKVLSQRVKSQLFQRSFTTKKEPGHGLGTYSVKLFTEKYLHGTVTLTSHAPDGTTVYIEIPRTAAETLEQNNA